MLLALFTAASAVIAKPAVPEREIGWMDTRINQMDMGPFVAQSFGVPGGDVAKGVLYDTKTVTLRAGWTGKFVDFDPLRFGLQNLPKMGGEVAFSMPGATTGARYRGLHLHGDLGLPGKQGYSGSAFPFVSGPSQMTAIPTR